MAIQGCKCLAHGHSLLHHQCGQPGQALAAVGKGPPPRPPPARLAGPKSRQTTLPACALTVHTRFSPSSRPSLFTAQLRHSTAFSLLHTHIYPL